MWPLLKICFGGEERVLVTYRWLPFPTAKEIKGTEEMGPINKDSGCQTWRRVRESLKKML